MSRASTSNVLSLLSLVLFTMGVVLSSSSILRYSATEKKFTKAISASEHLAMLEHEFLVLASLSEPFEALRYDALEDPNALASGAFGADHIEYCRQHRETCDAGFVVNQIELSLKAIALEKVVPFVQTCEALRPPIRLMGCTIHASTTQAGTGHVIFKLERIERQE